MKDRIERIANRYGLGIPKEKLVSRIYFELKAEGAEVWIINDRYIGATCGTYQIIKSKKQMKWIVRDI